MQPNHNQFIQRTIDDLLLIHESDDQLDKNLRASMLLAKVENQDKDALILALLEQYSQIRSQMSHAVQKLDEYKQVFTQYIQSREVESHPPIMSRSRTRVADPEAQFQSSQTSSNQLDTLVPPNSQYRAPEVREAFDTLVPPVKVQSPELVPVKSDKQIIPNPAQIQQFLNKQLQQKLISVQKFRDLQDILQSALAQKSKYIVQLSSVHQFKSQYYQFLSLYKFNQNEYELVYGQTEKRINIQEIKFKNLVRIEFGGKIADCANLDEAVGFY
ncbi:Hypothetical_protein [Hexamita inflata]|uniref:Hypothetical_protein n=1 Tax=Hexamita inflata TaxID=28002 RepID=A0AA86NWK3_9EUKA|nr:Hypothetical protein HINF_LOCUS14824 [Hexamita inflata]